MRFWYDTEFLEDGKTIELISIGIVCENEATYYAVNSDMQVDRIVEDTWMKANVWPHLPIRMNGDHPTIFLDMHSAEVKPKWVIANEVREFLTGIRNNDGTPVELWADYAAYDHVLAGGLQNGDFRLARPERIFGLDGCHRVDGVCLADV